MAEDYKLWEPLKPRRCPNCGSKLTDIVAHTIENPLMTHEGYEVYCEICKWEGIILLDVGEWKVAPVS